VVAPKRMSEEEEEEEEEEDCSRQNRNGETGI
jgi:hypothetical protein